MLTSPLLRALVKRLEISRFHPEAHPKPVHKCQSEGSQHIDAWNAAKYVRKKSSSCDVTQRFSEHRQSHQSLLARAVELDSALRQARNEEERRSLNH